MEQEYIVTDSIAESLAILAKYHGKARIIAGGTDLLLDLQAGKKDVDILVDINNIPSLKSSKYEAGYIVIGAGVTLSEVTSSPLLWRQATLLGEAAAAVGSPQIRNVATVVGNIINAQPAADTAVALVALEAEIEVRDNHGNQYRRVADCYAGRGLSLIDSTRQIVTGVRFLPLKTGQGSAFVRFALRKSLALPVINTAVIVTLDNEAKISWARIVLAPAGPAPFQAKQAESLLRNCLPSRENLSQAAKIAAAEAPLRDSPLRGSRDYRRSLAEVLVEEALAQAVRRAKEGIPSGCH
ncbi:FAD binding domain-containing protein [Moorella naiadis]|uniref:FAD binding domain-containing protein n=1 Tax=Moorella naiadis (nom. illeg.) TaxID=3093670 RepID=UPI003D9CB8C3